ncbi:response regulator transcription factor [Ktedonobacter racemifer]|uniref:Two component transcriptional regulator, LuxR family n=1 Tax=Ktedonobacter racemifer DSM 44963 TaxID=485913 RepID=D6TUP8_KTERA|nr:response regulator transcription factor [Ktedonobacter racemifer]EFH84116.1 two component transcriptional regulator, LuxR family [Ktedonobacter racemifer DSM 44963]
MPRPIHVVIADDHLMVRKGLRLMLEEEGGEEIKLVGDAADGAAVIAVVERVQPDVVVMDIRMPGMDGLAALERIRTMWPHITVLLLTTYDEDELLIRGLQAGASGYFLKETPVETLLDAIRSAARGEMLIQPETMARLLSHATSVSPALSVSRSQHPQGAGISGSIALTKRERQVLAGVAQGERSKEIAVRLGITERTVRAYLTSIYTKLNVDSRASAVAVALAYGLLPR